MLPPSYLLHAVEPAEEIAEQLHTDIMARIIERILLRFKRGDDYILTPVDKWQIETLQQAGFLLEDIQKIIAESTGRMQSEIAQAMEDAGVRALEYDDAIYRAAGLDPVPLVQSPYLIQLMQRDFEATKGEWINFTNISKRAIHNLFVGACDTAYHQAMTGMISPAQAVREALETIVSGGVYVEYPGGRKDTIETATARAVRTGISQTSAKIQLARMDEFNVDLVIVSAHLGARPDHHVWQGKIYSRNGGGEYPDFVTSTGYGTVTGLCGANCRHHFSPWFEGQGNPFEQYDSKENQKPYELEQRQRTLERRIRNTKREVMNWKTAMDAETDPNKKAEWEEKYQQKAALLQRQNKAYNQFCEDNGLKKQQDRLHIAKWNRSQAAKARAAAKKYQNSIENSKNSSKINSEKPIVPILDEETKPAENRLPNSLLAVTDHNKIQRYALNSNHPKGKEKARVFNSVLGFHYENWDALSDQIFDKLQTAEISKHEVTEYGSRYNVPIRINGLKNKSMVVNTVWQIDIGSNRPRLITITFNKKTIRRE
jgi:hypothetical protein